MFPLEQALEEIRNMQLRLRALAKFWECAEVSEAGEIAEDAIEEFAQALQDRDAEEATDDAESGWEEEQ